MTNFQDRRIARVLSILERDLSKRVPRREAAKIAHLDPAYFSKRFKRVVGMSFSTWGCCVRVAAAKRLLATIDLPISCIASDLGYAALSSFERNFRRHTGVSPREYRRLIERGEVTLQDDTTS